MTLLWVACSKQENDVVPSFDKGELGVLADTWSSVANQGMTDKFINGHSVGVFVTGQGYTPMVAQYRFNGTTWSIPALSTNKIYLTTDKATVYGFYPSNANIDGVLSNTDPNAISINVDAIENSFTGTNQTDYMYATDAYNGTTYPLAQAWYELGKTNANLYFHHALSAVRFIVNMPPTYLGVGELTQVKLTGINGKLFSVGNGKMDVANGNMTFNDQSATLTFNGSANINAPNTPLPYPITARGLIVPNASTTNIMLSMIIDGKQIKGTLPALAPANKWEAGSQYTYTVTFSASTLEVTNVSILHWIEVPAGTTNIE